MKHSWPFILLVSLFLLMFVYLHQKISIYVEAYNLSRNFELFTDYTDKRDHLMWVFAKETSLSKINQWAQDNDFYPVEKARVVALNLKPAPVPVRRSNVFAAAVNRLLGVATASALSSDK
jgi:hypothetical protein